MNREKLKRMQEKLKNTITKIRELYPNILAEEIVNVQPITNDALTPLFESAKTEEELKREGYRPVSRLGFMWIKE